MSDKPLNLPKVTTRRRFSVVLARGNWKAQSEKPEQETYTALLKADSAYAAVLPAKKEACRADNRELRMSHRAEFGSKAVLPKNEVRTIDDYSVIMVFEGHPQMWFGFQVDP